MYSQIISQNPVIRSSKILIVDDSTLSLKITTTILKSAGFTNIITAVDGEEALRAVIEQSPAIIISDIFMPKLNGYEFCEALRERNLLRNAPVIMQTSASESREIRRAYLSGVSDVLHKPAQKEELLIKVSLHLENSVFRKRIKEELDSAVELQNSIIPAISACTDIEHKFGLDLYSYFKSCSEVGGDFWGVKEVSNVELGIYNADIAGHGIAAAMNSFRINGIIEDGNVLTDLPNLSIKKLNNKITSFIKRGVFCTFFYGVINVEEGVLRFSAAAAPPMLVIRENGEVETHQLVGTPLGIVADIEYNVGEIAFNKNDIICLFSDALIESANDAGQFLLPEDIAKIIVDNREKSSSEIITILKREFKSYVGDNSVDDDLTIIVCKNAR